MKRTQTLALAAVALAALAVLASPAGAVSTAWTAGRLTHAVKGLTTYMHLSKQQDSRQGYKIRALGYANYLQNRKLHSLRVFKVTANYRLSAVEAQDAIQTQVNGGIIDPAQDDAAARALAGLLVRRLYVHAAKRRRVHALQRERRPPRPKRP